MERKIGVFFFFQSFYNKCRVVLPLWEYCLIPGNLSKRLLTVKSLQSFYKPLFSSFFVDFIFVRENVFVCAKGYGVQKP